MKQAIKVAAETEEGLLLDINLVPFGGLFGGRDLDGEYFTAETDLCLQLNPAKQWPLLYHHGHDGEIEVEVLGTFGEPVKRVDGYWVQAQIDAHSEYLEAIKELIRQGKLYASSGALNYLVETKADGQITRWALMEGSLTPTPSNLLARVTEAAVEKRFKSAGFDWAGLKAVWTTAYVNKLPDSAFLYIEPGGEKDENGKTKPRSLRHFPYKDDSGKVDVPHLRNALARIPQSSLADDIKKTVLAKAKRIARANGIDVADSDGKGAPPYFRPVQRARPGYLPQPPRRGMSQDTDGYADFSGNPVPGVTDSRIGHPRDDRRDGLDWSNSDDGMSLAPGKAAKFFGDVEGSYEDLIDDLSEALNRRRGGIDAPFGGAYVSVQATFPDHCIVKVCSYGDDDDDDLYRVPYTLDEEGEPVIGQPIERVQIDFATMGGSDSEDMKATPLALHIASVHRQSVALAERTKDLCERRAKEGRVLSQATRQRLQTLCQAMKDSLGDIEDLLTTTEPPAKADPARVRALELRHRHLAHVLEAIA